MRYEHEKKRTLIFAWHVKSSEFGTHFLTTKTIGTGIKALVSMSLYYLSIRKYITI